MYYSVEPGTTVVPKYSPVVKATLISLLVRGVGVLFRDLTYPYMQGQFRRPKPVASGCSILQGYSTFREMHGKLIGTTVILCAERYSLQSFRTRDECVAKQKYGTRTKNRSTLL